MIPYFENQNPSARGYNPRPKRPTYDGLNQQLYYDPRQRLNKYSVHYTLQAIRIAVGNESGNIKNDVFGVEYKWKRQRFQYFNKLVHRKGLKIYGKHGFIIIFKFRTGLFEEVNILDGICSKDIHEIVKEIRQILGINNMLPVERAGKLKTVSASLNADNSSKRKRTPDSNQVSKRQRTSIDKQSQASSSSNDIQSNTPVLGTQPRREVSISAAHALIGMQNQVHNEQLVKISGDNLEYEGNKYNRVGAYSAFKIEDIDGEFKTATIFSDGSNYIIHYEGTNDYEGLDGSIKIKNKKNFVNNDGDEIPYTESFAVEKIIRHRKRDCSLEYLVKWIGYDEEYNSWIARTQFEGNNIVLKKYDNRQLELSAKKLFMK